MNRRMLCGVLAIVLAVGLLPMPAHALPASQGALFGTDVSFPTAAELAADYDTTDEFFIGNATDLANFAAAVNGTADSTGATYEPHTFEGKGVYLTNDVAASASMDPIGRYSSTATDVRPFKGTFKSSMGAHYTVTLNMSKKSADQGVGLFGCVEDAAVSDITVAGRVYVNQAVSLSASTRAIHYVGGIAAHAVDSRFFRVVNRAIVYDRWYASSRGSALNSAHYVGGVVGYASGTTLDCVVNEAAVSCYQGARSSNYYGSYYSDAFNAYIGGVVGYATAASTKRVEVTRCANRGAVRVYGAVYFSTSSETSVVTVSSTTSAGGIIGYLHTSSVGDRYSISECYNDGAVRGGGMNYYNSANTGRISKRSAGICYLGAASACYNAGRVTVGSVAGTNASAESRAASSGTSTSCYYLAGSGNASTGATSVATDALASTILANSAFSSYVPDEVGINGGYPLLAFELTLDDVGFKPLEVPVGATLPYNGSPQVLVASNLGSYTLSSSGSGVTIDGDTGDALATAVGDYTVKATLEEDVAWSGVGEAESTTPKTVTASIVKGTPEVVLAVDGKTPAELAADGLSLESGGISQAVGASWSGVDAAPMLSAESSDTAVATVEVSGSQVVVTPVAEGEATITVSAPETSNYEVAQASFGVKVSTPAPVMHTAPFDPGDGAFPAGPGLSLVDGKHVVQFEDGAAPVAPSVSPAREATAAETFAFTGWSPEVAAATDDMTYVATYSSAPREYAVTWKGADGTVIARDSVVYGAVPSAPVAPAKAADAEYTYAFSGWRPEVAAVTGDAEYEAVYEATPVEREPEPEPEPDPDPDPVAPVTPVTRSYTVKFDSNGGTAIASQRVRSGRAAAEPAAPERADYAFAGWYSDSGLVNRYEFTTPVRRNLVLYAKWEAVPESHSDADPASDPTDRPADGDSSSASAPSEPSDSSGSAGSADLAEVATVPVYSMLKASTGERVYAATPSRVRRLERAGYEREGVAWRAPEKSGRPVSLMFRKADNNYAYGYDRDTMKRQRGLGFKKIGVAFYAYEGSVGVKVRQLRNMAGEAPDARFAYAASPSDIKRLKAAGWKTRKSYWSAAPIA